MQPSINSDFIICLLPVTIVSKIITGIKKTLVNVPYKFSDEKQCC